MNLNIFFRRNIRTRKNDDISLDEMECMRRENSNIILLDVRSPQEYNEGHIIGAINIPLYELWSNIKCKTINKDTTIIVYCKTGIRSKKALKLLRKCGYKNTYNLCVNGKFN